MARARGNGAGIAAACLLAAGLSTAAQEVQLPSEVLEARLQQRFQELAAAADGVLAITALDLTTGRAVSVNGDALLAQASVIKVPLLWRVMEAVDAGELDLNASHTLRPEEAVGGSGGLQVRLKNGAITITLAELLRKMIEDSDNTATNKVIALAGMERVNESMGRLGLRQTRLQRIMMDTEAARAGRENLSAANEMARLLQRVWQSERGGSAAGRRMVEWMKLVRGEIAKALPGLAVAAKTGELTGVRNEAAIVYLERRPYVLVVLHGFQGHERNLAGEVAQLVHTHFQRLADANPYGNRVWAP